MHWWGIQGHQNGFVWVGGGGGGLWKTFLVSVHLFFQLFLVCFCFLFFKLLITCHALVLLMNDVGHRSQSSVGSILKKVLTLILQW